MLKIIISILLVTVALSCKDSAPLASLSLQDDLSVSNQNWQADFADYPVGEESFYELKSERANLPAELKMNKKALLISGNNHSDDLFMYLKKKVTGLKANTIYKINFDLEFASNAAEGGFGIGGSPAESVYVGVGATAMEPAKAKAADNYYRLNIKKINQSADGADMKVIGHVGNGTELTAYNLIKRTGEVMAQTDAKGQLWLIVGTDSGFEGAKHYIILKYRFISMLVIDEIS
jgi:hypothetical protein